MISLSVPFTGIFLVWPSISCLMCSVASQVAWIPKCLKIFFLHFLMGTQINMPFPTSMFFLQFCITMIERSTIIAWAISNCLLFDLPIMLAVFSLGWWLLNRICKSATKLWLVNLQFIRCCLISYFTFKNFYLYPYLTYQVWVRSFQAAYFVSIPWLGCFKTLLLVDMNAEAKSNNSTLWPIKQYGTIITHSTLLWLNF